MEREKALPYSRKPTNKCGSNAGIRNCHLATLTVMIVSGQNHQWMLKLVGKSVMRNRIFI